MMTTKQREFHAPPMHDPALNMTTIELITVGQLRDHRGIYLGDANALQLIREHAAFAVARFQFSGPTKSDPAPNAGHSKPCGEVAGRNQS